MEIFHTPPEAEDDLDLDGEYEGAGEGEGSLGESSNTGGKGSDTGQGGESWALLNLILAILGLILAVLCALTWLASRRRNRAFAGLTDEEEDDDDVPTRSPAKTLMTIFFGILGAVLFVILERIFGRFGDD